MRPLTECIPPDPFLQTKLQIPGQLEFPPDCPEPNSKVLWPDLLVLVFEADGKVHLCSSKPSDAKGQLLPGRSKMEHTTGSRISTSSGKRPSRLQDRARCGKRRRMVCELHLGVEIQGIQDSPFKTDTQKVDFSGHMGRSCNFKASSVCLNFSMAPVS